MFKTDGNQALGKAQGYQPLCGCARDLQHPGDLILSVPSDEVEPASARCVVEAGFLAIRRYHRLSLPLFPEVRHPVEDTIRAGIAKNTAPIPRMIMAAADKSPHRHASGPRCRHAADTVFDYESSHGLRLHLCRSIQEEIRGRLATRDHLRREKPVSKM